jgi:hypothetical protein
VAGGPIFPHSSYPATSSRAFPNFATSGSMANEGLGVEASVGADTTWRLAFKMPPTLPTGTCKLHLRALANASTGAAKVNPKWGSVAAEESPVAVTRTAEGVGTVTWGAGDEWQYKELKVTLDADTPTGNETIEMDLVFETSSWTLAQVSTWEASVIFE